MSTEALSLRKLSLTLLLCTMCSWAEAATYQTVNFSVTAADAQVAEQVAVRAEVYRRQLAIFWLGKQLPNWSRPCRIDVREGALGAGGQTTFQFTRGEVLNWRMSVQGTLERILDSVLPHEVNHTIFACHFRRPLPRWADEGAATLFEHRSEQLKQLALLNEVIRNKHEIISLCDLLSMKEYPKGQRAMLTLYAQGYALADFLVQQKGRQTYLKFIADGERGGWDEAIRTNFDHEGIESLEKNWRGWVLAGMPKLTTPGDQMMVVREDDADSGGQAAARPEIVPPMDRSKGVQKRRPAGDAVVRSQSPEPSTSSAAVTSAISMPSPVDPMASPSGRSSLPARQTAENALNESPVYSARQEGNSPSIEAPVPRIRTGSRFGTKDPVLMPAGPVSAGAADKKKFGDGISETVLPRSDSGHQDPATAATGGPKPGLEQTAMTTDGLTAESQQSTIGHDEFDFDRVVLPRERKVISGTTPRWAGFPGQKKSF